jgi:hypothetical protein
VRPKSALVRAYLQPKRQIWALSPAKLPHFKDGVSSVAIRKTNRVLYFLLAI